LNRRNNFRNQMQNPQGQVQQQSRGVCFACGQLGHIKRNCPNNVINVPGFPNNPSSVNNVVSPSAVNVAAFPNNNVASPPTNNVAPINNANNGQTQMPQQLLTQFQQLGQATPEIQSLN